MDVAAIAENLKQIIQEAEDYSQKAQSYVNQWQSTLHGDAEQVDAMNNGFANQIMRVNLARTTIQNQRLKMMSAPVDICNTYSVSSALNDLACGALTSISSATSNFVQNISDPIAVGHEASKDKISDISTVAVSTTPKIMPDEGVLDTARTLREQALKTTVSAAMTSIKQDRENIADPLLNSASDDISPESIKKIETSYNPNQVLRKMAVMQAKELAASMNAYKQSIQKEAVMAMNLLQEEKQVYQ